jgi:hypothetical protein
MHVRTLGSALIDTSGKSSRASRVPVSWHRQGQRRTHYRAHTQAQSGDQFGAIRFLLGAERFTWIAILSSEAIAQRERPAATPSMLYERPIPPDPGRIWSGRQGPAVNETEFVEWIPVNEIAKLDNQPMRSP